jgi:hypothetical protein
VAVAGGIELDSAYGDAIFPFRNEPGPEPGIRYNGVDEPVREPAVLSLSTPLEHCRVHL